MRVRGWMEPADASTSSERRRVILGAYARGEAGRSDTMVALGMDTSDVQAFAKLMNQSGLDWPRPDRARAEEEADILLELAPALRRR